MSIFKQIAFILAVIILSFLVGYAISQAWTEPTEAPPGNNVSAPVNIGTTAQTKQGALQVTADFTANRLLDTSDNSYYIDPANTGYAGLFAGKVGIGDASPSALLTVGSGDLFQVVSTGHVRTIAGTVGGPSYSFTGDTNTGIYSGGADILRFVTAGADRMTILANGDAGIGTTNPGQKLTVAGTIESTTGGFKFPDATIQTTAGTGGACVVSGNDIVCSGIPANTAGTFQITKNGVTCPIWKDCDGDGKTYGNGDCDESCSTCYVGSTVGLDSPDNKDQNCNGVVDEGGGGYVAKSCIFQAYQAVSAVIAACQSYCSSIGRSYYSYSCGTLTTACYSSVNFSNCTGSGNAGTVLACYYNGTTTQTHCLCQGYQ